MQLLSAVIITRNEEKIIGKCLDAVKQVADEIIIVDSFSNDKTVEICNAYGARVFQQEWKGFGPQKNFGVERSSYDMILAVDADEILSAEAIKEVRQLKETGLKGVYEFKLIHNYFGKFMKHGAEKPSYKKRLFDKRYVKWNQNLVHEALVIPGDQPVIKLQGIIEHYSYLSIEQYIAKANFYTTLGARELKLKGKKNYYFKMLFSPGFVFFDNFFLKAGFLDGFHGFIIALFNSRTNFLKYAKLWELYKNEKIKDSSI